MTVHEGLERNQLGELAAQNFGVTAEVMNKAMSSLEVFGEVAALKKAIGSGRGIHKEVRGSVQLNDNTAELVGIAFAVLEEDVFDVRERIFNLVSGLLIVDVVGHGALVRRIEDDEIHSVLPNSCPLSDAEGSASKMMDH